MAQVSPSQLPRAVRNDRIAAYVQVFGNVGTGKNTGKNYDPRNREALRRSRNMDW